MKRPVIKSGVRKKQTSAKGSPSELTLREPGWTPAVRASLLSLIRKGAGQGLPAVFDFDNTLVCGDIGEATLAVLARDRMLRADALSEGVSPAFRKSDGGVVRAGDCIDATEYYELFLSPTTHRKADPTPLANGYVWAAEAMQGLKVSEVVRATEIAFQSSEPGVRKMIEVTPGRTAYPAPYFYPEMVELIALLLRGRFDVWIVSASNVWSVRWMVLNGLNPLLRKYGIRKGLASSKVVGVSLLLKDSEERLWKDPLLVAEDPAYAAMEEASLEKLTLTGKLHFPVPTYSGKVACLWDLLGRRPYLCAGDSPGDHAMLSFAEHRLWIARLDKPKYLLGTRDLIKRVPGGSWLTQPTLTNGKPGFVTDLEALPALLQPIPNAVRATVKMLRR